MSKNYCVLTTINSPTKAVEVLHEKFGENLIVVGDEKTPKDWNYKNSKYILELPDKNKWYEGYAPANSYARKNLGYIEAIKNKAASIIDTDDDNIPNNNWKQRSKTLYANNSTGEGWYNVYHLFTNESPIWTRGFSLKHLKHQITYGRETFINSSIQQGLADNEPDVDAIFRLIVGRKINFSKKLSVYLQRNTWCPFNSQSTTWFPNAYVLMYLPVYSTMRMTDIWRSFVAQRCLWEIEEYVTFHSPSEMYQQRNEHDLMKDFADEVPGYLHNEKIVETLSSLKLKEGQKNMCDNMVTCYQSICDLGILPEMEMRSLKWWIKDYEKYA